MEKTILFNLNGQPTRLTVEEDRMLLADRAGLDRGEIWLR
jgi:hypothetical protein